MKHMMQWNAYDLQVLGVLNVSTLEDERSPEEAAARLKPRVPGQRIIDWGGDDVDAMVDRYIDQSTDAQLERLLADIDRMEREVAQRQRAEMPLLGAEPFMLGETIAELKIRYNTETEQSLVTCDGRAVYSRWPNYPAGVPDVLTARGWMPMDMMVVGETVMGIPASEIDEAKPVWQPAASALFTQLEARWDAEERRADKLLTAALWIGLLAMFAVSL